MKRITISPRFFAATALSVLLAVSASLTAAEEKRYKPFVLAETVSGGDVATVAGKVSKKLTQSGFEIVGKYNPYPNTTIIVISSEQLRQNAAQSELGAYGAIQRVTVTKGKSGVQVSFTNPTYMSHAYRMKSDLADVTAKLGKTLGHVNTYGSEKGVSSEDLRDYQYKWAMPYFTDRMELASYSSHQKAVDKVEAKLSEKIGGVAKIYRVDLPGKDETVIGVSLPGKGYDECSGDQYIMSRIDFKDVKSTGHLPYEMVISKGKVYGLFAEFRIAINFPDLSMIGSNSFASIMCAPGTIKSALTKAAGGKLDE